MQESIRVKAYLIDGTGIDKIVKVFDGYSQAERRLYLTKDSISCYFRNCQGKPLVSKKTGLKYHFCKD